MLITETVVCKWNGKTKKYYEAKGYIFTKSGDSFEIPIKDLQETSLMKIDVKCDFCDKVIKKQYNNYIQSRKDIQIDCCSSCVHNKSKITLLNKYGVDNSTHLINKEKHRKEKRISYKQVVDLFNSRNATVVISEDEYYKKDDRKIAYLCNKHSEGGIKFKTYNTMKNAKYTCDICSFKEIGGRTRTDGKFVVNIFKDKNLTPLFDECDYKNSEQTLPFICNLHPEKGIQHKTYINIRSAKYCCEYGGYDGTSLNKKKDINEIISLMEQKNMIPTSSFFEEFYKRGSGREPIYEFICTKHSNEVQLFAYSDLHRVKCHCRFCAMDNNVRNLRKRLRGYISFWRRNTEKKDGYKCVLSGEPIYDVHHLNSFHNLILDSLNELKLEIKEEYNPFEFDKLRESVVNKHKNKLGVCLSKNLHMTFHSLYGNKNNTEEQFNDFSIRYHNGEFKNYD